MKTTLNIGLYLQKDLDDTNMQLLYKMQKHYTGNKKKWKYSFVAFFMSTWLINFVVKLKKQVYNIFAMLNIRMK